MIPPSEPKDEAQRLVSLRALNMLDTAAEERFDRITRLAKLITGTPIALLTLVDANRQWFKSRQGLDAAETPRDISFCGHAILGDGLFVVPDATKDPRFSDNPLVTSAPDIRLYAGFPLKAPDGQKVGTLCVIDNKPRDLSPGEREAMALLGAMIEEEFRLAAQIGSGEAVINNLQSYRALVETSDDAIVTKTLDGVITGWNPGAERMFGYTREEAVGRQVGMVIPEDRQEEARLVNEKLKNGERADHFETMRRRKNGTQFWVLLTSSPLTGPSGKVIGVSSIARDITELKTAEGRIRLMLKSAPVALVAVKADGDIVLANGHTESLFGFLEEEMAGRKVEMLLPERYRAGHPALRGAFMTAPTARPMGSGRDLFGLRKDGTEFPIEIGLAPIDTPEGRIVIASIIDLTPRKEAEKAVVMARDSALKAARAKADFLANMSHEIRTPMNAIIGMTGLLLDTRMTEQQRDYVKTVSGAGEALLTIINDILDFSKIESGKLTIEKLDFSLPETIESTMDLLAPRAREKGIALTHLLEAEVPAGLRGDQGRLRQVLLNLMGNALKFTGSGKVELTVSKEKGAGDATVLRFSVKDTGIGIPREAQGKLFQVFSQADASTTRKYGGSGLGLSISKKLVELMGGDIGLESEPGKGSTFWFTLPFEIGTVTDTTSAAGLSAPSFTAEAQAMNRYFRVLIAEDNIVNQKVAVKQLQKLGYEADVAANGLEAVEALKRRPYDLVLMDCQMPEMDGFQATAEIRRLQTDQQHTPIVAMTANALQGDQEKCLAAGMDGYMSKPVRIEKLAEVLRQWDTALDTFILKNLRDLAGPETPGFVAELADTYLNDLPQRLEAIRAAVNGRNAGALTQAAHALKGSSGNIGARRIQKLCLLLEEAGRSGSLQETTELLPALEEETNLARAALESLAKSAPPGGQ